MRGSDTNANTGSDADANSGVDTDAGPVTYSDPITAGNHEVAAGRDDARSRTRQ